MSDRGDTAWVLACAALALLLTAPGLALYYAGLVRQRNALATLLQPFAALCVVSVQWVLFGYSLAFAPDRLGGLLGGLAWAGLRGVGAAPWPGYSATVPHQAVALFQMMLAAFAAALIAGAFAERMRFSAFLLFTLLWSTLVYDPIAHWVWSEAGFLRRQGVLDFAGGTVVHLSAGASALVCALVIGPRRGHPKTPMPPHNLPLALAGAGLLWVGWLGADAGSALGASALAANAFLATSLGGASGALGWMAAEWRLRGTPTALGTASGAIAGLVALTPACGFVGPLAALAIGAVAGALCFGACHLKARIGYDDALDVVGVHGVGAAWGVLATGLFAGPPDQLRTQLLALAATVLLAVPATWLILKLVDALVGLRVREDAEEVGLDISQHQESGYAIAGPRLGEHVAPGSGPPAARGGGPPAP